MNNLSHEEKKSALIEEIEAAFDGVAREDGVTWNEAWVIDVYGTDEERAEARKIDTETRWQDVPDEYICNGHSVLNFLDEKGFHYYLPSYITWCLRDMDSDDPKTMDSMTLESLISRLVYYRNDESLRDYHLNRYKRLSPEQSKVVAHFLAFMAEREDVIHAEFEQMRQDMLKNEGMSQEEIDALAEDSRSFRLEHDLPENESRSALERYWGQFLE